jgi:hypothetical protein
MNRKLPSRNNKSEPQSPEGSYTLDFLRSDILCSKKRPCKRIVCPECRHTRGAFIRSQLCARFEKIDSTFLTVRWSPNEGETPWEVLCDELPRVSSLISAHKIAPRIVVLAVGLRSSGPHAHLVVRRCQERVLTRVLRENARRKPNIKCVMVTSLWGLADYLWNENAVPSFLDPDRPKRLHPVRTSRGIKYAFPTNKDLAKLNSLVD